MPHPAAIPTPPAGRSFAFAATLLSAVALGLAIAATYAIVRELDLPDALPPRERVAPIDPPSDNLANGDTAPPPPATRMLPLQTITPPAEAYRGPRPGALQHPEVSEMVEIALALKNEGDTAGALKKLRMADGRLPDQPRILWELAEVYRAMALDDKADAELARLRELGAEVGGEYFELATLSLGGDTAAPHARHSPDFSFGITLVTLPTSSDGERVLVRLAIRTRLTGGVAPSDLSLIMEFYDLVDGSHIEETHANPPLSRWPTAPVDWAGAGTEIVEWEYHMPPLDRREIETFGQRQYYGYIARLYYKDRLQDVYAEPRTLLARPAGARGPALLDDSLFPNPN